MNIQQILYKFDEILCTFTSMHREKSSITNIEFYKKMKHDSIKQASC